MLGGGGVSHWNKNHLDFCSFFIYFFIITSFSDAVWVIFMFLLFPLCPLSPPEKKKRISVSPTLMNSVGVVSPLRCHFRPSRSWPRQPFYLQFQSVTHSWYFSKRFVRARFCLTFPALVTLRQHYCTEAAGWLSHLEEKIITAAEGRR